MPISIRKRGHPPGDRTRFPPESRKPAAQPAILLLVPLQVFREQAGGAAFQEDTTTLVVSARGALLQLREPVRKNQTLLLKNSSTGEQVSCVIRGIGATAGAFTEIGVEFSEPRRRFWRVAFPPPDWSPRSPEAKRFVSSAATALRPAR